MHYHPMINMLVTSPIVQWVITACKLWFLLHAHTHLCCWRGSQDFIVSLEISILFTKHEHFQTLASEVLFWTLIPQKQLIMFYFKWPDAFSLVTKSYIYLAIFKNKLVTVHTVFGYSEGPHRTNKQSFAMMVSEKLYLKE